MKIFKALLFVIMSLIAVAQTAAATADTTATVITNAPIYVTNSPGPSLVPLRVAAVGTTLKIVGEDAGWLQIQFEDPQWGRRTGWIQKTNVRVSDPNVRPMNLSIRDTPTASPVGTESDDVARNATARTAATAEQPGFPRTDVMTTPSQARDGFWFNAGLGVGSLGCDDCSFRENGLSGGLSLGSTLGDKWLLGVGTTGWAKDRNGDMVTVGTLDARFRFYPARSSGFFLTGGAGLGTITFRDESELGVGVVLGVGWDIRVARNVSLTPFYNGFAMRNSLTDANVGQLGLGVTIH
jgi:hypothetical protein